MATASPFQSDQAYLQAIKAGGRQQEQAVRALFDQHYGMIVRLRQRYGLKESEAVDVYTDGLVAFRKAVLNDHFRGDSKLSTYLFAILQHKAVDQLRKKSTHTTTVALEEARLLEDPLPPADHQLVTQERFEELMQYFDQLGDTCRKVLLDRYYWGYTDMKEIAERHGIKNANTAGSLRHRCLKQLMKLVGQ